VTVEDRSLIASYGTPGADGTLGHTWGVYTDDGCTSESFLRKQAQRVLYNGKTLDSSFEFELEDIDSGAMLSLGDDVQVIDEDFGQIESRVYSITRQLSSRTVGTVRIGKRKDKMVEQFRAVEKESKRATGNSTSTSNYTPHYSSGSYNGGYTGSGGGGSYVGGGGGYASDGWVHQIDGVTQSSGTVNFITAWEAEEPQNPSSTAEDTWGGTVTSVEGWGTEGEWGGTGGGKF
jgi:hypothetical protein